MYKKSEGAEEIMGAAEFIENKTTIKPVHHMLGNANFKSLIQHRDDLGKHRLICIIGVDRSGRTHLANMIAKKFGHKIINDRVDGKKLDAPALRKQFFIPDRDLTQPKAAEDKRIAEAKKQKFVLAGHYTEEDLSRIFKGKGRNRNFLLIFVQPKEGCALKWQKMTGGDRNAYDDLRAYSEKYMNSFKKYRFFVIQNDFTD